MVSLGSDERVSSTTLATGDTGEVVAAVRAICRDNLGGVSGGGETTTDLVIIKAGSISTVDSPCSGSWNGGEIERIEGPWMENRSSWFLLTVPGRFRNLSTWSDLEPNVAIDPDDDIGACGKDGTGGKGGGGDVGDVDTFFPSGIREMSPALKDILNGRNLLVD